MSQLRSAREAAKLTQADVARRLASDYGVEIDPSGVARMEQGHRTVRLDEAVALADLLGISLVDVIQPPRLEPMSSENAIDRLEELYKTLNRLDSEIAQIDTQAQLQLAEKRQARAAAIREINLLHGFVDKLEEE